MCGISGLFSFHRGAGQPEFPEGIFDRRAVRRYWEDHLSGLRDVKWGIWTLMALQWWARTHRVPAASRDV